MSISAGQPVVIPDPAKDTPGPPGPPGAGVPAGTVTQYAGTTAPSGYLFCDGGNYLPTDYPSLYTAIGQNYSAGTTAGGVLGAIEVGGPYSYTGATITIQSFGPQVNFNINVGSTVTLSGANAATGSDINGLKILITAAPPIGTTGGTFTGTFLNPPPVSPGTGDPTSPAFMDMIRVSFQVPDLQGVTIRGRLGTGNGTAPFAMGTTGGADSITLTPQNLPSHAHGTPGWANQGYVSFNNGGIGAGAGGGNYIDTRGSQLQTDAIVYTSANAVATASGASGTAVSVIDKYLVLPSIIKT
jgi:microcystin-dependent protein